MSDAEQRFERAVDAVRRAATTGDREALRTWAETAESVWHEHLQPALDDGAVADLRAHRLVDLRKDLLHVVREAALVGADPVVSGAVAEALADDLALHPGDDGLVRLRMVALAMAGDRAGARRAYDDHRQRLSASSGLEPSIGLQELVAAIDAGDDVAPNDERRPFLLVSRPDGGQDVVDLPAEGQGILTIGRSPDRSLPLPHDAQVSREHAEIRSDGAGHVLLDVGSSNGTRLNNRPVQAPMRLVDGDLVRVGATMLIYRDPANASTAGVPLTSGTMVQVMPTPSSVQNPSREPVEELDVTILFCDLRGWTSASGQLSPQRARGLLDAFYDLGSEVVTRHGGTVLQMAGDEVYACFGAPVPRADHADRALQAALDLQAHEATLGEELDRRGLPTVRFGIGLNSGPVAPFSIGAADRRQLGLVGTTVNVAARLCSVARAGEVVYAASLVDRLGRPGPGEPLPPLELKNVAQPVMAFRVGG